MNSDPGWILLLSSDAVAARGIRRAATKAEMSVVNGREAAGNDQHPSVVVVDLEHPGAIDQVAELREEHPDAILVGHVSMPDPERWVWAERAGCDIVTNRGSVGRKLASQLESGEARRRRFPLLEESDVSGRLGFVARVDDTPVGAVAVHQINGEITASADTCPHAGADLSPGELEGCVVTCPRHGSQFDVTTGERLRGPADRDIDVHQVIRESGRVQLVWL